MAETDGEVQNQRRLFECENIIFELLPHDIVLEIVLTLSTRSLMRLKCTCNFFHKFLSDPMFIDLHLARERKYPGFICQCPGIIDPAWRNEKKLFLAKKGATGYSINKIFNAGCIKSEIISSGGLMAWYDSEQCCFHVSNPILGEEVKVSSFSDFTSWGFGYCSSSKVYKIVKIVATKQAELVYGCEIYTIGADQSWRKLAQEISCIPSKNCRLVEFNGTLFWKIKTSLCADGVTILSFDLRTETFLALPGPPDDDITTREISKLVHMEDTIAYVRKKEFSSDIEIWMLRDKAEWKWIQKFILELPPLDPNLVHKITPVNDPWLLKDAINVALYLLTIEDGYYRTISSSTDIYSFSFNDEGTVVMFRDMDYKLNAQNLMMWLSCCELSEWIESLARHTASFVSPLRIMATPKTSSSR